VRVEAQLAQILSLVQPGARADAGATAEPPHAAATPEAARRERAGDGAATSGNDDKTIDGRTDGGHRTDGSSSDADSLLGGLGGGAAVGGAGVAERRNCRHQHVAHPDGFDDPDLPGAGDIIRSYEIPHAVQRHDGIPVPFEPSDARFLARFKEGSSEYHEAAFAYQMAAWSQELSNAAVDLFHGRDSLSSSGLADRLAGAAIAARQLFHLATAHYDYLEYRQRDPVGAELYRSTDAVPRNTLRGPNGRRWLSIVARDEVKISVKAAAEERASQHRRRGPKRPGHPNANKDATAGGPQAPRGSKGGKQGGGKSGGGGGGSGGGGSAGGGGARA